MEILRRYCVSKACGRAGAYRRRTPAAKSYSG
jgi:hypothetical protein